MAGEFAPQAIFDLFSAFQDQVPEAAMGGILGDPATHAYGYHRSRNWDIASGRDGPDDYSVQLDADRAGDGDAAAALDISLPPELMRLVTGRLVTAARAGDPRLASVREFCGTLDSVNTFPWQLTPQNASEGENTWDDSHLSHIHLSILRRDATNADALRPIADVMAGLAATPSTEVDDMVPYFAQAIDTGDQYLVTDSGVHKLQNDQERAVCAAVLGVSADVTVQKPAAQIGMLAAILSRPSGF